MLVVAEGALTPPPVETQTSPNESNTTPPPEKVPAADSKPPTPAAENPPQPPQTNQTTVQNPQPPQPNGTKNPLLDILPRMFSFQPFPILLPSFVSFTVGAPMSGSHTSALKNLFGLNTKWAFSSLPNDVLLTSQSRGFI